MKAQINDCGNNVFVIRNSRGLTYQVIGTFNNFHWTWMETFLVDMTTSPNYVMAGHKLTNIPHHVSKKFKELMSRQ